MTDNEFYDKNKLDKLLDFNINKYNNTYVAGLITAQEYSNYVNKSLIEENNQLKSRLKTNLDNENNPSPKL